QKNRRTTLQDAVRGSARVDRAHRNLMKLHLSNSHVQGERMKKFAKTRAMSLIGFTAAAVMASACNGGGASAKTGSGASRKDGGGFKVDTFKAKARGEHSPKKDFLIYAGSSAATDDPEAIADVAQANGWTYDLVTADDFNKMSVDELATYGAIAWPGGYAGQ